MSDKSDSADVRYLATCWPPRYFSCHNRIPSTSDSSDPCISGSFGIRLRSHTPDRQTLKHPVGATRTCGLAPFCRQALPTQNPLVTPVQLFSYRADSTLVGMLRVLATRGSPLTGRAERAARPAVAASAAVAARWQEQALRALSTPATPDEGSSAGCGRVAAAAVAAALASGVTWVRPAKPPFGSIADVAMCVRSEPSPVCALCLRWSLLPTAD